MIREKLREIHAIEDETRQEEMFHQLILELDDLDLPEVSKILKSPEKALCPLAVQIAQHLGYPRNISLLPALIANIGDKNSLIWPEAVETVAAMERHVVLPFLLNYLWERAKLQFWGDEVEGICGMLSKGGRDYAIGCGPYLAGVLAEKDIAYDDLDKDYLLDVFETIGPAQSEYALPALLQLAGQKDEYGLDLRAKSLLAHYSQEALAPYALILAHLDHPTFPK